MDEIAVGNLCYSCEDVVCAKCIKDGKCHTKVAQIDFESLGNVAFKAQEWERAIEMFTKAIELDPTSHILYSNRSAAYTRCGKYLQGFEDAQKTMALNPSYAKGQVRMDAALKGMGDMEAQMLAYMLAREVAPKSEDTLKQFTDLFAMMNSLGDTIPTKNGGKKAGEGSSK